jgi:DNA-binding MarR family transcriptional regulator
MNQEEKLLSAIFNVGRLIREKIFSSNCLADFTHTEIEVLNFLQGKKNATMRAIADHLHIKPSSTTPVIDNLAKRGDIKRVQDKGDRRVIYIELNAKGLKCLKSKYKTIHKSIKDVFGKLKENDKKNLIKIFEKIHDENT